MSEEEKKSFEELKKEINKPLEVPEDKCNTFILYNIDNAKIIVNLIEKQQKEIENLKEQKCEWFELYNSRVLDIIKLEQEVEELKEINEEHQKLNGELEEENTRQHELLGNIHQNYRDKITKIQEQDKEIVDTQYISKDKIREKIKDLKDNMILFTYTRNILEKLLEEE